MEPSIYKCAGLEAVIGDAKFHRNSRGVILHGPEGEEEGDGPDGLRLGVADDNDGGQPAEARAADGGAERPPGAGPDGEHEAAQRVSPDSDGEFADDAANAADNKYAACRIHEVESGSPAGPSHRQSVSTTHDREWGIWVCIRRIQQSRGGTGPTSGGGRE